MEQSTRGLSTFKYEDKKQSQKHYPFTLQSHYEIFTTPDFREGADPGWGSTVTACSLQATKSMLLKLKMHIWVENTLSVEHLSSQKCLRAGRT